MKTYERNGKLIIALSRALQNIHRNSEVMFREENLTFAQFTVLEALFHKGQMSIQAIIESVLSTSGNMTVVIRNLEKKGYVERIQNSNDKRSFLITLTQLGREKIKKVFGLHMQYVDTYLQPLNEEEKDMIISLLRKI